MSIFVIAAIIGLLLPLICLVLTWRRPSLRTYLGVYLLWQFLQIGTEKLLAVYSLRHVIKFVALGFVLGRLVLLWVSFKNSRAEYRTLRQPQRYLLSTTYILNCGFWIFVVARLVARILASS